MVRNEEMPQMGPFAVAMAAAVKASIEAAGVSGSQVARHIGRAQSYASVRISGRKAWTLDELDQVARLIGARVEDWVSTARCDR